MSDPTSAVVPEVEVLETAPPADQFAQPLDYIFAEHFRQRVLCNVLDAIAGGQARDRAIVLVALVTGLRRSELAALRWSDLEPTSEGLLAWVRRSKTDQAGEGRPVAVPRGRGPACPVRALREPPCGYWWRPLHPA